MFESLIETVKAFSFQSVLRGNILSSPGSFSGSVNGLGGAKSNSPASNMVSNRYLSTYYNKMREIGDYEINELTDTIIGIYVDFLTGYFNKDGDLVIIENNVKDYEVIQSDMNRIMNDLEIVKEVKDHLWDIIYNGTYCFRREWDADNRKFVKNYLCNPHNVVTIRKKGKLNSYLVVSRDGVIHEVKPDSIFRIGKTDLELINDVNKDFFGNQKSDTLVRDEYLSACTPLYYNISQKVKEYLLREQILSLLSIKDLIQPLLLLIRLDKNTSVDEGNKLALNIENMINKYSDISSIISSNFSINSLIDSLMNNIRVIPDYHSAAGDMNNIDLSKITQKIQDIESSQENKKDVIMNSKAIPKALYNGESTKWDALKSSERLRSTINKVAHGISDSIKLEVINICRELTGRELDPDDIKINIFKKTEVDYTQMITNTEIASQLLEGVQRILTSTQQTLLDVQLVDAKEYAKYVYTQIKEIDPNIATFINEDTIVKGIERIQSRLADRS